MALVLSIEKSDAVYVRDRGRIRYIGVDENTDDGMIFKVETDLPVFVGPERKPGFREYDLEHLVVRVGEQITLGENPAEVKVVVQRRPDQRAKLIFLQTASHGTAYTARESDLARKLA